MILLLIVGITIFVSLISFIGALTLVIKGKLFDKILFSLIGFSAGALIGSGFFHLLPEALEKLNKEQVFLYFVVGFVIFLILERFFHWRHCHDGTCDIHA